MPYGLDEGSGPIVEQEISKTYIVAKEMLSSLEKSLMGPPAQEPRELTPIERGMKTPSADSVLDFANADNIHMSDTAQNYWCLGPKVILNRLMY